MRRLNGKGVVSTKEAFQTRSKTGTQHNAAMAAFSQMEGARSTARSGPRWRAATHAATSCPRGAPACLGLPSRAERESRALAARPPRAEAACRCRLGECDSAALGPCRHRHDDWRAQEVAASERVVPPVMPSSLAATGRGGVAGFLP